MPANKNPVSIFLVAVSVPTPARAMREPGGRRPVIEDPPDEAFDPTLPGLHTYLGNVGDVGSAAYVELLRVLAESGGQTVVRIPVVVLLGQVFFPGETIPLTFDQDDPGDARLAFEACMAAEPHLRGLFGVFTVYPHQSRFDLGTLAEIRQFTRGVPDGDGDDARMSLLARGRLRFTIRDEISFMQRVMDQAYSRGFFHYTPTFPDVEVDVLAEPPVGAGRGPPRGTFGASGAPLTPHSAAVYGMFDAHALADRLRQSPVLHLVCGEARVDPGGVYGGDPNPRPVAIPRDPVALSYWVAARLPIPPHVRVRLLRANDAVERLRLELKLVSSRHSRMNRDARVRCRACDTVLTSLGELVAMSQEGASGMYVNPHGIVHDMITVEGVKGGRVRLEGEPETAHSWFPGYAWTVCRCARCDSHLGWRFTPAGDPRLWGRPAPTTAAEWMRRAGEGLEGWEDGGGGGGGERGGDGGAPGGGDEGARDGGDGGARDGGERPDEAAGAPGAVAAGGAGDAAVEDRVGSGETPTSETAARDETEEQIDLDDPTELVIDGILYDSKGRGAYASRRPPSKFFGLCRSSVVVDTERSFVTWNASDSDADSDADSDSDDEDDDGTEGATQMLDENPAAEELPMETNDVM